MANNVDDWRSRGEAKYGELWEPLVKAVKRGCDATGVSDEQFMSQVMRRADGFEFTEAVAHDVWAAEETDGNRESGANRTQWYVINNPNSRKARWQKGQY